VYLWLLNLSFTVLVSGPLVIQLNYSPVLPSLNNVDDDGDYYYCSFSASEKRGARCQGQFFSALNANVFLAVTSLHQKSYFSGKENSGKQKYICISKLCRLRFDLKIRRGPGPPGL